MSKQLIPGNNAISVDPSGWVLFKRPHGTFYSTSTQTIANTAATQKITYNGFNDVEGLKWTSGDSKIYVPTAGSYEIFFSGIADLKSPGPATKYLEVWVAVDGTPAPYSNTRVAIPNLATEMTVAVAWILDLTAGQYVELETWGDDTDCEWLAYDPTAASPARPYVPSVITTVKKISSRLSYE